VLPALWSVWHFRKSRREHPLFQVPLVAFIVILTVLSVSSTSRTLYAVPMLLPITMIAVPGVPLLPAKAKVIANRVSILFFGGVALLLWFGWFTMMTGSPAVLAQRIHEFQPDYVPSLNGVLVAAAVLYSLAWLFAVISITRSPDFAAVNWTLGVVLTWGLIMTLWLPALNAGSSFRAPFTSLKKSMPDAYTCLASRGLGDSERAMLEYFTGVKPRRVEVFGPGNCDLLLEQRGGGSRVPAVDPAWQQIWQYSQPSSRPKDIFTLYQRVDGM
jgi:4-amino-4-deoxy-L-arabinose transferase-like glycosyltransferase